MVQNMIPCFFLRGGTSRGTYFLKEHLPSDRAMLDKVLLEVMGSPDPRQIDGLGGASTTTSKVAVLSVSNEPGVDIDFLFAQVSVTMAMVDWSPSCGNILAGVGPAAIEMGLVKNIGNLETKIRIRLVNTGGFVEAVVKTPGGEVTYEGDVAIDGVPGTSAPIELNFVDVVGSKTGKLLPTGNLWDVVNGVVVTCIDCAVPMVIARASAMGKTGYESKAELDADVGFFSRLEGMRRIAGEMMGLGEVAGRVIPKFAIVGEPRGHGNITARYFDPTVTHPSMAVTGAISISCCSILEGTVAYDVSVQSKVVGEHTHNVVIEHPLGEIPIILKAEKTDRGGGVGMDVYSAGAIRTARLLFTGMVRVPSKLGLERFTQPQKYREMNEQFCQLYRPGKDHRLRKLMPKPRPRVLLRRAVSSCGAGIVNLASPQASKMPVTLVQAMSAPAIRCTHQFGVSTICRYPNVFL